MNLHEALAANLRQFRGRCGLGQTEVADGMRKLGFTAWRSQTVSKSEQGMRRLMADEIFGLAMVLGTNVANLMDAWTDGPVMFLNGDQVVPRKIAAQFVTWPDDGWRRA